MTKITGFTILELLCVVALITILSAILFPVFAKAKERAHLTQDVSQMRQVYVGVVLYEQDYDDVSPHSLLYSEPYLRSELVFVSPQDPFPDPIPGVYGFPADLSTESKLRSPFRISYSYLYPIATAYPYFFTDAWFRKIRQVPSYGLIATQLYNPPYSKAHNPCPPQFDILRYDFSEYRICMDGSFSSWHGEGGVSFACSVGPCFGENPPFFN